LTIDCDFAILFLTGLLFNMLGAFHGRYPRLLAAFICLVLRLAFAVKANADPVDWPTLGFSQVTSHVFNHPVVITHAGDNSGRLFIVEQPGLVWINQGSSVLTQPFLNI
jgi:hypothetical protein